MKNATQLTIGVFMTFCTAVCSAATIYSDDTFSNGNWVASKIYDTTPGQSATFSASQTNDRGNPGAFWETVHIYGVGDIAVAHLNNSFTYDPAIQGPISSLAYSYDLRAFRNGVSGGIGYSLLAYQNSSYYVTYIQVGSDIGYYSDDINTNQWVSFSHTGLTADDFLLYVGSSHPDFSTGGSPITFGFLTANGTGYGVGYTDSGIDNYYVSITSNTSAVSIPGTIWLFGSALMGLAGLNVIRKGNSKSASV